MYMTSYGRRFSFFDDIEPLSKNEFLFVFDLKSMAYKDKENGQALISEDLSSVAPELGLEPRTL